MSNTVPGSVQQALQTAMQHHSAGRFSQAEAIYRQVLSRQPNNPDALHLLGVLAHQARRYEVAVELIGKAITIRPNQPTYHINLGNALKSLGQVEQAIASYGRALEIDQNSVEAMNNLGNALNSQGRLEEAIVHYQRALKIKPDFAEAHYNLGNALSTSGRLDEAIGCYRRTLSLKPNHAEAHNNLGTALKDSGQLAEAIASYQRAIALKPEFPDALSNLGNALKASGKFDEAIACHQRALALRPNYAEAHNNLGNVLTKKGQLDEAIVRYERALALKPDFAEAHGNLGDALIGKGEVEQAIARLRRAAELKPNAHVHGNLLYALYFHPGYDSMTILRESQQWDRQYAQPFEQLISRHDNDRSPERRLRIGYVSPDFRNHPIGRFLLPLLGGHDHEACEVFCYSSSNFVGDEITAKLRGSADVWRDVIGLSDAQLAERILADRIDILVDVTMHMVNSRLLVFARKPAPVQVTYLAYCGTTGLGTMDYRLTDPYLDPPGTDEGCYAEKSIRLAETYWCYQAPADAPVPGEAPAIQNGYVTFGCLNNFCKLSPPALMVWRDVMQAVPTSRLILHAHEGSHRDRVLKFMADGGIGADRIEFSGLLPTGEYLKLYGRIDIALDPFPYVGGTTTCDALWMGVPVVTLAGQTAVGRGGVSILSNVGAAELIAKSDQEYLRIATQLASDLPRLRELRSSLRTRMQSSPLMDPPRFARNVELAYRQMWRNWCAGAE